MYKSEKSVPLPRPSAQPENGETIYRKTVIKVHSEERMMDSKATEPLIPQKEDESLRQNRSVTQSTKADRLKQKRKEKAHDQTWKN